MEEKKINVREFMLPMKDPWQGRSQDMLCRTCMWFLAKAPSESVGRCRRHAPIMAGFPVVFTFDWCGDHKLNEIVELGSDGEPI